MHHHLLGAHLRADVVELGDGDGGGLPDVGILVLQAVSQGLAQVLSDLVHPDAAHGADGQRPGNRNNQISSKSLQDF